MKINLDKPMVSRVPEIGEVWKHKERDAIFMRIADCDGIKILGDLGNTIFYSIDLSNCNIVHTPMYSKSAKDIIVLDNVELAYTQK